MKFCVSAFIFQPKSQEDVSDLGKDLMVASLMIRYQQCAISFSPRKWQLLKHLSLLLPGRLPPTSPATRLYSQRVYFQIMVWMGMANEMNPTEWGWKQESDQLIPIMTQNSAAPDKFLKIIHCNCVGGCKSSRCSFRHYGPPCTAVCGPCQTENCDNPNNTQEVD